MVKTLSRGPCHFVILNEVKNLVVVKALWRVEIRRFAQDDVWITTSSFKIVCRVAPGLATRLLRTRLGRFLENEAQAVVLPFPKVAGHPQQMRDKSAQLDVL